ncbi:MAG: Hint domain-containing protein [Pseudomonadota bacterium]
MVNITGSDNLGGVNQSGDNTFDGAKFWYEWVEFTNSPNNLTEAGFDISDGSVASGTTIYNAGGTDNLDALATNASASVLGDDVSGDRTLFGFRVTTTLNVTNAGTYRFDVRSDDGVRLYVDGTQVLADDSLHAPRTRSGSISLASGEHEIVIIYFERTGQNVLEVDIQSDAGGDYPAEIQLQNADVLANRADDTINGREGDDTVEAGAGNDVVDGGDGEDTLDGGSGNDTLTGGDNDDDFIVSTGTDRITDFGAGNSGSIDDGDQTNNDFVDLSNFYNSSTLAAVNAADGDPEEEFASPLGMLRKDAVDGTLDGIIDGVDYSAEIGDIDLSIENGGASITGLDLTFDNTNVACFTRGTRIATAHREMPVETLRPGMLIETFRHGLRPLRCLLRRRFDRVDLAANPRLCPIRIEKGALGHDLPRSDLVLSPQHRVLVRSAIARRMFGTEEVLIAANKLLPLPGVAVVEDAEEVEYFHLLLDAHEIIFSNGAPTESLLTGMEALRALTPDGRNELLAIFPEVREMFASPAAPIPPGHRQKRLIARHAKNNRPLLG